MKIKTANIRIYNSMGVSTLKPVNVKETFWFADELFFIHRGTSTSWVISHYKTGLGVCYFAKTVAAAKAAFEKVMEKKGAVLQKTVKKVLKEHGAANCRRKAHETSSDD